MAKLEYFHVVPLAVFDSGTVPERYAASPEGFKVNEAAAVPDGLTVVPITGRVTEEGIRVSRVDTRTARVLGSIVGWLGQVHARGLRGTVAEEVTVEDLIPFCTDNTKLHNNRPDTSVLHMEPALGEAMMRHRVPLKDGLIVRTRNEVTGAGIRRVFFGDTLLPHCNGPLVGNFEAIGTFKKTARRVFFSQ